MLNNATDRKGRRKWLWVLAVVPVVVLFACITRETASPPSMAKTKFQPLSPKAKPYEPALKSFFLVKQQQAKSLVTAAEQQSSTRQVHPEIWKYFEAGIKGDWRKAYSLHWKLAKISNQYEGNKLDERMSTPAWQLINETFRAYEKFANCDPNYIFMFANSVTSSIPAGSIYFGGSDPGRFIITFCNHKSPTNRAAFFDLSQNTMADGLYQSYLRHTYGGTLRVPSSDDGQTIFQEYLNEAQERLANNANSPDEHIWISNGWSQVSGFTAVHEVCGKFVKFIVDNNPDRRCFLEQGVRFRWIYPHLVPHGFIFEVKRQYVTNLTHEIVQKDHDFWTRQTDQLIGPWLKEQTSLTNVLEFTEKVYLRQDLSNFSGDRDYVQSSLAWKHNLGHVDVTMWFSSWRTAIGEIYAWRAQNTNNPAEQVRMAKEADYAFRQALALCPYNTDVIDTYLPFLALQKRFSDGLALVNTSYEFLSDKPHIPGWKKTVGDWFMEQERAVKTK